MLILQIKLKKLFDSANGPDEEFIEYEKVEEIKVDIADYPNVIVSGQFVYKYKVPIGKISEIAEISEDDATSNY